MVDVNAMLKTWAGAALGMAALVLVLLWMEGFLGAAKTEPGEVAVERGEVIPADTRAVAVERRRVEDVFAWPGTVYSHTTARIAPKLSARIQEIRVDAGDTVQRDQILVRLDDHGAQAREREARAALNAALAEAGRAEADARRSRALFAQEAATRQMLDQALADETASRARVEEARNALAAARVQRQEMVLRAPFDGIVVERLHEPGDMGMPGKAVVVLQDPERLRMESFVPASCALRAHLGMTVTIRVDTLGLSLQGVIDEIAPMIDPQSRTVLIKAALPKTERLLAGGFGWLEQACGEHTAVLVPKQALRQLGQLEMVKVVEDGRSRVRHVRSGKQFDDQVEILSGLKEGEQVLVEERVHD